MLWLIAAAAGLVRADEASYIAPADLASASGAEIYSHICQACHMSGGQGAIGAGHYPKLAGDPQLVSWEFVAWTVVRGRNGMPAFGRRGNAGNSIMAFMSVRLGDTQIAKVVNYVRSHFGNTYKETVTADQVAKLPHPGAETGR
jgi:mono/diheme cytochrome c family protein